MSYGSSLVDWWYCIRAMAIYIFRFSYSKNMLYACKWYWMGRLSFFTHLSMSHSLPSLWEMAPYDCYIASLIFSALPLCTVCVLTAKALGRGSQAFHAHLWCKLLNGEAYIRIPKIFRRATAKWNGLVPINEKFLWKRLNTWINCKTWPVHSTSDHLYTGHNLFKNTFIGNG